MACQLGGASSPRPSIAQMAHATSDNRWGRACSWPAPGRVPRSYQARASLWIAAESKRWQTQRTRSLEVLPGVQPAAVFGEDPAQHLACLDIALRMAHG